MGSGLPKQFIEVNGKPIIIHTLDIFEEHPDIDEIYVACKEEYIRKLQKMVQRHMIDKVKKIVPGGATGQDSIYNALKTIEAENEPDSIVLLHDGVRPFVSYETIQNNIEGVKANGNAITCTSCFETILLSEGGETVDSVPFRKDTYAAQAPQSFYLKDIIEAHDTIRQRPNRYENMVDNCTIIKTLGQTAHMVPGNRGNIKVTTPEDVYIMRALLQYQENEEAFGLATNLGSKINSAKRRSKRGNHHA